LPEGNLFALALTIHMQEVAHDEHLWVRWHSESLPEVADALRNSPTWQEERRQEAALENFGFHRVEKLSGNIGYLDIHYFHRENWAREAAVAAMNHVADASALIIDLRRCTGGFPAMLTLVASYLFDGDPLHLSSIYWRDEGCTQEFWTLPDIPGKRFIKKPVFALTSKETFSAGEGFASILQSCERATIIGEKTDGGAHPGASYRLHPHMEAFIPIGQAFDPLTGKDLEGIGVTPDISLPQEHAYWAAYYFALKAVLASPGSPSGATKALVGEVQSALNDLESTQNICPQCGYQNRPHLIKCKNCDASLSVG
jgi:C-terminal processing protease CtpA/Prc